VFRYAADTLDPQSLQEQIRSNRVDLAICRVPAICLSGLPELEMPYLVGDILVHYALDLRARGPAILRFPDLEAVEATPADMGRVRALIRETFAGYVNHYSANPTLDRDAVLEGQVEWGTGFLENPSLLLFSRKGEVVAWLAFAELYPEVKPILGGVCPAARGSGFYLDTIRYAINSALERRCKVMHVSTQIHNLAVQKAWVDEGMRMWKAEVTFHVNANLGKEK